METIEYICNKYNIDLSKKSPFEIPCGRWEFLPALFKELDFKIGAEIGVSRGKWTENLFKSISDLKMFCIDRWLNYPNSEAWSQRRLNMLEKDAREKLKKYNCEIIKKFSMDAVKDFESESLDFVFIDANHTFKFITEDIYEWSKKVRKGGIVSGHDYISKRNLNGSSITIHVKNVVQAWTWLYNIHPWFVMRDNRLISRGISWMWVKE